MIVGPTASTLFQLGFAAPTREASKSLDSVIGLRVRSHTVSPPRSCAGPAVAGQPIVQGLPWVHRGSAAVSVGSSPVARCPSARLGWT